MADLDLARPRPVLQAQQPDLAGGLEAGAVLLGSQNVDDFPLWTSDWEGPASTTRAALINGENLDNVAITGRGTIDGRGQMWWRMMRQLESSMKIIRPRLIRLVDCRNVLFEGVTLTNSPAWTLNPLACDNVMIRGLTVINPPDSPNTDGINPDSCRNVRISDCHIDVGDDCVTIKSGSEDQPRREYRACENVVVTNCTMIHGHGGVVIGSEMSGGVRNVAISNCTFVGTDRGIRINVVSPGPIDTPGVDGLAKTPEEAEQIKKSLIAQVPLGRMGRPDRGALFVGTAGQNLIVSTRAIFFAFRRLWGERSNCCGRQSCRLR